MNIQRKTVDLFVFDPAASLGARTAARPVRGTNIETTPSESKCLRDSVLRDPGEVSLSSRQPIEPFFRKARVNQFAFELSNPAEDYCRVVSGLVGDILQELAVERLSCILADVPEWRYAKPEGCLLTGFNREIQGLSTLRKFLGTEGIRREQAISSTMPVGGIRGVLRMIAYSDDYIFALHVAGKCHHFARVPGILLSDLAFTAQIDPRDTLVSITGTVVGRPCSSVKTSALVAGSSSVRVTRMSAPSLLSPNDLLIESTKRDYPINDPQILSGPEDHSFILLHYL